MPLSSLCSTRMRSSSGEWSDLLERLRLLPERAQHELRRLAQRDGERAHQALEHEEGRDEPARDALGVGQRDRPRRELAEDDVEVRHEGDGEHRAERDAHRELDGEWRAASTRCEK